MNTYRIKWEMVSLNDLYLFCDADPRTHRGTSQVVPNSEIPDQHWHVQYSTETSDPWQQVMQLKEWADQDREFVRNVSLERLKHEPQWEEVPWILSIMSHVIMSAPNAANAITAAPDTHPGSPGPTTS